MDQKAKQDMNSLVSILQSINEVEYAVIVGRNGLAIDDDSYEGNTHAAHAAYISMLAGKIGNQMGVGNLQVAAIHGVQHHILMYQQRTRLINFVVSGSTQLGTAEQNIFKTLSNQK
jgi:predicted regulator of Ras-like GTPase activity (Roadblock/LC7/MglB family)